MEGNHLTSGTVREPGGLPMSRAELTDFSFDLSPHLSLTRRQRSLCAPHASPDFNPRGAMALLYLAISPPRPPTPPLRPPHHSPARVSPSQAHLPHTLHPSSGLPGKPSSSWPRQVDVPRIPQRLQGSRSILCLTPPKTGDNSLRGRACKEEDRSK